MRKTMMKFSVNDIKDYRFDRIIIIARSDDEKNHKIKCRKNLSLDQYEVESDVNIPYYVVSLHKEVQDNNSFYVFNMYRKVPYVDKTIEVFTGIISNTEYEEINYLNVALKLVRSYIDAVESDYEEWTTII